MVLTDLEICILALGSTYNMKKMKKLLPYGVKNRLRWKNGLFLKKCGNQMAQKIEMLDEKEKQILEDIMSTIFSPEGIYTFFYQDNVMAQIYISQLNKVKFLESKKGIYEISEILDDEDVWEQYLGFEKNTKRISKRAMENKKMKRKITLDIVLILMTGHIILFITFILLIVCCVGIIWKESYVGRWLDERGKVEEKPIELILDALDDRNREALKGMFSKEALDKLDEDVLNKQIDELLQFYEGESVDYADFSTSGEHTEHGIVTEARIAGDYEVETTKGEYCLYFFYQTKNMENPDSVGLQKIRLIKAEVYQKVNDFQGEKYAEEDAYGAFVIGEDKKVII